MDKLEKKNRPYAVVPYNPKWAIKYEKEKKIIANIFKEKALSIEHIGSTSVKGMWAKPQIDILVVVNSLNVVNNLVAQMKSKGYIYQSDFNKYNERYFTCDAPTGERLVSVHVMQQDNPQALSHIYLREYLKKHLRERNLYSQIKRKAYESGADREEYPKIKRKVLVSLLEKAKKWAVTQTERD